MKDFEKQLESESNAEENSFLLDIRANLTWDHDKFKIFLSRLYSYCNQVDFLEKCSSFFAQGFWFVSHFIKDWSSHPSFRSKNKFPDEYYEASYELVNNLSYWFFMQEPVFTGKENYIAEINKLDNLIY